MKQGDKGKLQLSIDFNISQSTLYNIEKEFNDPIKKLNLSKSLTSRNFVESPILQEIIKTYFLENRTP